MYTYKFSPKLFFSHRDVSVNVNDKPFQIFNERTILFVCLNIKWFNLLRIHAS